MTGGELAAIVGVLLTGSLISALVAWRRDRRQAPIERTQATEATEKLRSEIRTADIDGLRDIIEALRENQDRDRAEIAELRTRVEKAETRAAEADTRALAAERRAIAAETRAAEDAAYIEDLLTQWPTPPPPPRRPVRQTN